MLKEHCMKRLGNGDILLSYPEKISRLGRRLREPQWRRYALTLMAGKMLALAVLFGIIFVLPALANALFGTQAYGQTTTTAAADPYALAKGGDIINPLNT